jgi:general secretion pathway protein G
MKKAFTIIELMIAVTILGILAAVVVTTVNGQISSVRQVSARNIVKTLRNQIELYKLQHNGQPPGLINGTATSALNTVRQFIYCTRVNGSVSPFRTKSDDYNYGPYLSRMAANPYNNLSTLTIVSDAAEFSTAADDLSGWLYKISTAEIRINSTETAHDGAKHYEF